MTKPLVISDAHYEAIGRVVVTWARLESHMIRALEAVLQIHFADAAAVFWHMPYQERRARLINLVYLEHTDKNNLVRREFDELIKRMDRAVDVRNIAAHCVWFRGKEAGALKPFVIRVKGADFKYTGRGIEEIEFTAERLRKEAEKIARLAEDFKDFFAAKFKARFVHKGG
jgi:hypothetical protein